MAKVQISLDDELLEKIDKHADSMYMSRSGFISYACSQVIMSSQAIIAINDVALSLRKISDEGSVSEEDAKKLEDFERIVKMMSGSK